MRNAYVLRKTLAQVAALLALCLPPAAADELPAADVSASYASSAQPARVAYSATATSNEHHVDDSVLSLSLIENATLEVESACRVLDYSELYGDRSFSDYLAEVAAVMESWRALTPHAQDEAQRTQQLLHSPEMTAAAMEILTTSLALARQRLAESVETLAGWNAVQRAASSGDDYLEIPTRFLDDRPIAINVDSPMDPERIQAWVDLNEV